MNNDQGDKPKMVTFWCFRHFLQSFLKCVSSQILFLLFGREFPSKLNLKSLLYRQRLSNFYSLSLIVIQLRQSRNNLFKSDYRALIPSSQVNFQNRCFWPLFSFKQLQSGKACQPSYQKALELANLFRFLILFGYLKVTSETKSFKGVKILISPRNLLISSGT
ncbi:Hypothetical_protein [Hexamita inflata]|uniref:Hypothetical_protein n=1 Tax=Hexamita inflata TaxID=28002 RepID=A0AA86US86_9EUKA|nr:Hypothetical protein HINF_LOCUS53654 [Hexamita inflata]